MLRPAAGVAVALAALGAAACGRLPFTMGAAAERPLWASHPGTALRLFLHKKVRAPARAETEEYERGRPALDPAHLRVFFGSSDRGLYAVTADTGAVLWRYETLGAVQGEPLYDPGEDVVYFGSNDGALYKVRAADGELLWRFSTNAEVARVPVLHRGTLYFANANDTVIAVDPASGRMRWSVHRTPALGMEVAGYAGVTLHDGRVYTAFSDGVVMAYSANNGAEAWAPVDLSVEAEQATGDLPRFFDADATPIVARIASGEVVFAAGYAGGVFALDARDGGRAWVNDRATGVTELVLWREPAHAPRDGGPMIPERALLLASSGTTGLWALDPDSGAEVWRRELPAGGISAPVPILFSLLVATSDHGLFLLSPTSGAAIDGIAAGGIATTPAAHGSRAFAVSNGGALFGVQVEPPGRR